MFDTELTGIYRGKVLETDANESVKLGRVKLEIPPYLVGEETANLMTQDIDTRIDGMNVDDIPWAVPAQPLFFGAKDGQGSFSVPTVGSYVFAFFEGGNIFSPVYFANAIDAGTSIPEEAEDNYPDTFVFKTPSGCSIVINDNTGEVKITSENNMKLIVGDNVEITSSGNVTVTGDTISITGTQVNING